MPNTSLMVASSDEHFREMVRDSLVNIPNAKIAGASVTAMSKLARSRVGSVVRPTSINGDGPAAFILAATQANTRTERP